MGLALDRVMSRSGLLAAVLVLGGCHALLPLGSPADPDGGTRAGADSAPGHDHRSDILLGPWADILLWADGPTALDAGPRTGPSCTERYGQVSSFELCSEGAGACTFGYEVSDTACADLCAQFGGACIDAYDGSSFHCAEINSQVSCDEEHSDGVCTCTNP